MRLLLTATGQFVEFPEPRAIKYAILSHTWDPWGEQTFQDVRESQRAHAGTQDSVLPVLSEKVRRFCEIARSNGYEYGWVDSCCIDKTSSSELSEAINSIDRKSVV